MIKQIPRRLVADGLTRNLYLPAHLLFNDTQHQIFADVTVDGAAAVRHIEGEGSSRLLFSLNIEAEKKESHSHY
jgi:hypothetical protein